MRFNVKKSNMKICFIVALICVAMVTFLLLILGMAPFGDRSMAGGDINVSQLDQYTYLKNCLLGKDTFGYSFSMGLGGDTANVVAYGMSSPFNLLILFFDQSNFHTYFDVMVIFKIAAIGFTTSYYLQVRFSGNLRKIFVAILSLSFAFSQYCIAQIVNIFWLDGVALLPIILLGVYQIISENKPFTLIISVFLSILFGWYTGVTDCLFAIFWFFLEYAYYKIKNSSTVNFKVFFKKAVQFAFAGITGALLSGFFFLPVLASIRAGNRGTLNWDSLILRMNGNLFTVISNDVIGGLSDASKVSLYCGAAAIIGCVALFMSALYSRKWKITTGIFLLFVILTFYWQPLFLLFSMLKNATSFWFRFSYIGTFTIVFIASQFFSVWDQEKHKKSILTKASILWIFLIGLTSIINHLNNYRNVVLTGLAVIIIGTILVILSEEDSKKSRMRQRMLPVFLVICCVGELGYNAKILLNHYGAYGVDEYKRYVERENNLINQIKSDDDSVYRISQSLCRMQKSGYLTANYNEPLGYNYMGITAYTNCPDDRQRNMLNKLGYRTNGENFYIVNTSFIPTDSLLGVKYFLSDYAINGYKAVDGMTAYNNKTVYENPYVLPMAFTYDDVDYQYNGQNASNPFLAANETYSALYGKNIDLFTPAEYTYERSEDGTSINFFIKVPSGNFALYGNLPYSHEYNGVIKSGDTQLTEYAKWRSPSVFYIPTSNGEDLVNIEVTSASGKAVSCDDPQFYILDLDAMKQVSENLQSKKVNSLAIDGNTVTIDAQLEEGESIFTSFAYDKGWVITDNGKEITPDLYEECLIVIKSEAGEHHIVMKYKQPGQMPGIVLSVIGFSVFIFWYYLYKKQKRIANR